VDLSGLVVALQKGEGYPQDSFNEVCESLTMHNINYMVADGYDEMEANLKTLDSTNKEILAIRLGGEYNKTGQTVVMLDYYSGNSSYKVTDNKDNFVYDGTDSYGSHVWRVVISDGKQGIIEVTKNEVTDFNDGDFNLIKEFIGTINPNVPDSITIEGITVNTK